MFKQSLTLVCLVASKDVFPKLTGFIQVNGVPVCFLYCDFKKKKKKHSAQKQLKGQRDLFGLSSSQSVTKGSQGRIQAESME